MPRITVLVPVYNGASHLGETLTSLLTQTYKDFELLIIDDGSTDNSVKIIESFSDPRIRVMQKENGGLCSTLNLGIQEARGEYIARSDQDDISFPHRLDREMTVADKYPETLGVFAYNTKIGRKHSWANSDKLTATNCIRVYDPINDGCLLGSTMLVRTSALREIGGFRERYYPVDDWDLECRLAEKGQVLVVCEPLVAYRFHRDASTYKIFAEMQRKRYWAEDSHRRRIQNLPELSFEEFLIQLPGNIPARLQRRRLGLWKLHTRIAGQHLLDGNYLRAAVNLTAASVLHPIDISKRIGRMLFRERIPVTTSGDLRGATVEGMQLHPELPGSEHRSNTQR
jgi:glycosyltransferase involved in cell wall biosynthesis